MTNTDRAITIVDGLICIVTLGCFCPSYELQFHGMVMKWKRRKS